MSTRARTVFLGIAFTLSGAAALVAEQVFEKLLSTLVGASTPAGAVVLAIYFAGLTTGALLYPRVRRLRASPLAIYPALELLVVVACLALAWRFDALVSAFAPFLRLGAGRPALLTLLRGIVAAVWILPLTLPMGATFPAIIDAVDRLPGAGAARTLSALYAVNLAGAIAAAVGGPIVIFPIVGMKGGLGVAAALDVVAALLAILVAAWSRHEPTSAKPAAETSVSDGSARARVPPRLLFLAASTGFLLFALEVSWTHLACAVIGNSVYAFASMLASVLIGLGLGGAASAVLFPGRGSVPEWAPGAALVAGAVSLECTHPLWPAAPHAVGWLGSQTSSFAGAELARFAVAAGLLVPPATVLGLAYPLLFRVRSFPTSERGGAAGRVTAINAVGCILGSLTTGFLILPRLGSEGTERALIALTLLVGGGAVVHSAGERARGAALGAAAAVLVVLLLLPRWDVAKLTSGEHVYFRPQSDPDETELVFVHEDTLGGITTVTKTLEGEPLRTLYTNGKFQGNDGGEMVAQTSFAFVPMQYVSHFDRALVVGLGTGRTAGAIAHMGFGAVEVAEIAPGIVLAARDQFAHVNEHVLAAPNVSLSMEDGRNLLLLREATYDLVTIELTSVWFAGATSLYSQEFYALVRSRLRPGGVLQQWIQLHHIGEEELASVLATVHAAFPVVSLFVLGGQGIIVASEMPQVVQEAFVDHLRTGGIAAFLGVPDDAAARKLLAGGRLLAPEDVDHLSARPGIRLNTDANRLLEYATPRYNYRKDDLFGANVRALTAMTRP